MKRPFYNIFFIASLFLFFACKSNEELQLDISLLTQKWICSEVYHNDKKQEIFTGAYMLDLKHDNSYIYKAGMFEDEGNWTISNSEILLTNQSGEQKSFEILHVNDTSLVVEIQQMGADVRMHLNSEI